MKNRRLSLSSLVAISVAFTISSSQAQSTWNAGTAVSTNGLWSTATNWSADTAPIDGADLIFDGAENKTNSNDIPLTSIGSLTLNNAGWNITLGTLTLNGGITAAGTATLGGTLTLATPQTWSNTTGILTITGTVANGTNLLTVGGAGDTTVSAVIGNGTGGLTKTGAGRLTLSGINTFSGQVTVQEGSLSAGTANNISSDGPLGNNALSVILGNTGGVTGTLRYSGASATSSKPFTMATGGSGAFNVVTAANTLTLSGLIDGSGGLTKTGPGTLSLTGTTNSYSGGTVIADGGLTISADNRLGNTAGGITFDGTAPKLTLTGAVTSSRPITLLSGAATIDMTVAANHTFSGKVSGAGSIAFTQTGGAGGHNYTLSALDNDFTGAISINSGGSGQSATLTVNSLADPTGSGNISISSNAGGNSSGNMGTLGWKTISPNWSVSKKSYRSSSPKKLPERSMLAMGGSANRASSPRVLHSRSRSFNTRCLGWKPARLDGAGAEGELLGGTKRFVIAGPPDSAVVESCFGDMRWLGAVELLADAWGS